MDDTPDGAGQADLRHLRFLRLLVTVLTVTMIVGFLVLIALLVTRFPKAGAPVPLPEAIRLPDGTRPVAFTRGSDWVAVVTAKDEILILDAETGTLRQRIAVTTED